MCCIYLIIVSIVQHFFASVLNFIKALVFKHKWTIGKIDMISIIRVFLLNLEL